MYLYALTLAALVVSANAMGSSSGGSGFGSGSSSSGGSGFGGSGSSSGGSGSGTSGFSSGGSGSGGSDHSSGGSGNGGKSMAGKCNEVKFGSDIPSSRRTQYCEMMSCLHLASASDEHCVEKGTTTTGSTTPGCAQTDGLSANSADCTCGSSTSSTGVKTCTGVTGLFCTAATSTCAFRAKQQTSSECAAGKMKSSDGTCVNCVTNKYQDQVGQSSCKACPSGKVAPQIGSTSCAVAQAACASGKMKKSDGTCVNCSPGKFIETGDASCSSCVTNKYQDEVGKSSCKNCPSGKVAPQIGSTSCAVAQSSEESHDSESQTDQESLKGKCNHLIFAQMSNPNANNDQKIEMCKAVSCAFIATKSTDFCSEEESTSATATCAAGKMKSTDGTCVDCSAGQFIAAGEKSCDVCPTNKYQDQVGQSSCKNCQSGKVAPQTGSTSCVVVDTKQQNTGCPKGRTPLGDSCADCAPGQFKATVGSDSCQMCPVGYASGNTAGQDMCTNCPSGWVATQVGSKVCATQQHSKEEEEEHTVSDTILLLLKAIFLFLFLFLFLLTDFFLFFIIFFQTGWWWCLHSQRTSRQKLRPVRGVDARRWL